MSIVEKIQQESLLARKEGNTDKADILTVVLAALKDARIAKPDREELTEDEEIKVVFAEAKKIKDSIVQFKKAGRDDLAEKESSQLKVIEEYLPAQASDEDIAKEVDKAIEEVGAAGMAQMGQVMGVVMKALQGKADGSKVNQIVKEKLSE